MAQQTEFGAEAPKMFRIRESPDSVKAFRVSKDAVIAAAVFASDEVHIYRLFDTKGDFVGDKKPIAPVQKFKLFKPEVYGEVIDILIHKKVEQNGQVDYQMYLVSTNGVLFFNSIEKTD